MRCQISVVVTVLNNRAVASESHLLKNIWRRDLPAAEDFYHVDFAAIARGFGVHSVTLDDPSGLDDVISEALSVNGPALVYLKVSKEAQAPTEMFRGNSRV